MVFALPRGAVVLGVEIAKALEAQLDLIVIRKIGHPDAPEYTIAAIADDGHSVENTLEVRTIDKEWFEKARQAEQAEARRRRELFLGERAPIPVEGSVAIIVDDGLATGLTMSLAIARRVTDIPPKSSLRFPLHPLKPLPN